MTLVACMSFSNSGPPIPELVCNPLITIYQRRIADLLYRDCAASVREAKNKRKVAAVGARFVYEVKCLDII
jgi:hypothetical protein